MEKGCRLLMKKMHIDNWSRILVYIYFIVVFCAFGVIVYLTTLNFDGYMNDEVAYSLSQGYGYKTVYRGGVLFERNRRKLKRIKQGPAGKTCGALFLRRIYILKKATATAPGPAWVPITLPMVV